MRLREGEHVIRIVKRHVTPFLAKLFEFLIVAGFLFGLLILLAQKISGSFLIWGFFIVSFFVGVFLMFIAMDYLFDQLVITNLRLLCIDWKTPFRREEQETELVDIQHIDTRDKGILSRSPLFNYGKMRIETAASKTTILFNDAPDPDQLKFIILSEMEKATKRASHREVLQNAGKNKDGEDWSVN